MLFMIIRSLEKTVRQDGEDPSKFSVTLETLAVKAFRDMGPNSRTQIIRDRFIAGHPNSALQRHLDSVPPETPIRDRCRVWESHADTDDRSVVKPTPERAQPVYEVSEPTRRRTEQVVAAVTGPSVGLADLETMLKCLLPAVPAQAQAPPSSSAPTDLETMLTCLLPAEPAQAPPPRSAPTEIVLLDDIAPVTCPDLADPYPADFAPVTLRNLAETNPACGFSRRCLPGFANRRRI